jgi:hypothetical protein
MHIMHRQLFVRAIRDHEFLAIRLASSVAQQLHRCKTTVLRVELYQSYASAETEATIYGLVGITTNVVVAPASGVASATNPIYTLTGCYLESHTPINASLGELSTITLTFTGGVLTKAVA